MSGAALGVNDADVFDDIVIGAGPVGCAVVSRLSEDSCTRVCLLEAGPDRRGLLYRNAALHDRREGCPHDPAGLAEPVQEPQAIGAGRWIGAVGTGTRRMPDKVTSSFRACARLKSSQGALFSM